MATRMMFGQYFLDIDEDNRITLPEHIVKKLGTKELAAVVGDDDRVLIWRAEEFPDEILQDDIYLYI